MSKGGKVGKAHSSRSCKVKCREPSIGFYAVRGGGGGGGGLGGHGLDGHAVVLEGVNLVSSKSLTFKPHLGSQEALELVDFGPLAQERPEFH